MLNPLFSSRYPHFDGVNFVSAKPNFTNNSTETITAYIGQTVDLPCNSSGYPPPSVTITPSIDPTGKNRYTMTSEGLRIRNLETGDQ